MVHKVFSLLGDYSYPIYLVHPVFLSACTGLAAHWHIYLRAVHIIAIYIIGNIIAWGASAFC